MTMLWKERAWKSNKEKQGGGGGGEGGGKKGLHKY